MLAGFVFIIRNRGPPVQHKVLLRRFYAPFAGTTFIGGPALGRGAYRTATASELV
jgi:hypothetical protein